MSFSEKRPFVLGILREGKQPADLRTPLTPAHCAALLAAHGPALQIHVQEAPFRCYTAAEYEAVGASIVPTLSHADVVMGVKEVPKNDLMAGKPYLFFSHTIKRQPANRSLLQTILEKQVRLIDYEMLTFASGERVAAFGHFAGIVGAHNGLLTFGRKTGAYALPPAHACLDYAEMVTHYTGIAWPPMRVAVAGTGRTAKGAIEVLNKAGFSEVSPEACLSDTFDSPIYTVLPSSALYARLDGQAFDRAGFHKDPTPYRSTFGSYAACTDVLLNCVFWDVRTAPHFTLEEMKAPTFTIRVIADISCDINGSVPCTVRSTTIFDPVFGWDAQAGETTQPYLPHTVDVMAVDNLPCELPRDASTEFGNQLLTHVMPQLLASNFDDPILARATIAANGHLQPNFNYLNDYVAEPVA